MELFLALVVLALGVILVTRLHHRATTKKQPRKVGAGPGEPIVDRWLAAPAENPVPQTSSLEAFVHNEAVLQRYADTAWQHHLADGGGLLYDDVDATIQGLTTYAWWLVLRDTPEAADFSPALWQMMLMRHIVRHVEAVQP